MKTAEEIRTWFKEETGTDPDNSQGDPDIEYVWWLENRLIEYAQQRTEQSSEVVMDQELIDEMYNWSDTGLSSEADLTRGDCVHIILWLKTRLNNL